MKATEAKLIEFLRKSPQFVIPIYQRTYSWTERECRKLWDDILRAGNNEQVSAHFVGSIVYIQQGLFHVMANAPVLVIDGQQRLTTVSLLLAALAEALDKLPEEAQEPVDGFSPRKLRNWYLLNPEESGDKHYKLLLTQTDKDTLISIIAGREQPTNHSLRVIENYQLFQSLIAGCKGDLVPLCTGLAKLVVVDISLSRDQDNPQLIFESMNSTGRELTQADLIRNFILMGLEPERQTRLYEQYWRPMEVDFGQEAYGAYFDSFMRHYLTVRTGEIPNVNAVYEAFKSYARTRATEGAGIEELVADIRAFARYFCAMALGAESDRQLAVAFHDLRELKVEVAYPFLLELYHDYATGILPRQDFVSAVRLVEAYVFRRAICSIPTNSMNKTFATFGKSLKKDRYLESVRANFLLLPSYRRFPTDEEFRRDLQSRDLYNFRSRSYWLRRLENHKRKERVTVDEYTIEHILPQNPNLSSEWQTALGPAWEQVQQMWLHTLGNLTLTGYNSEYSDRSFAQKRDMDPGGFWGSPLNLNAGLGRLETWNEDAIRRRAERLSGEALGVWAAPRLDADIVQAYRGNGAVATGYRIEDHPYLIAGPLRALFDALRKEVLALDPCVTEEILKLYIAFKAETNFVDVVPRSKELQLSLNIKYPEIDDPRHLGRDVAGLGRWGNGDVEVRLADPYELPYVLGLIRQALEKQLGNGDGA